MNSVHPCAVSIRLLCPAAPHSLDDSQDCEQTSDQSQPPIGIDLKSPRDSSAGASITCT